ncbi:MAG TPA: hypothetical protein VIH37_05695 [Candidatus Limnocylindrales bacterium]
MMHSGLTRAVAILVGAGLVVTLAGTPAGAQTGGRVVVDFGAPITTDAWYAWGGSDGTFDPVGPYQVSASAPSVRLSFPVSGTDADPATATLGMASSLFGDCAVSDPAGMHMDGWTLVLDPAAMASSYTGACIAANSGAVFSVWVDAQGPRDHLKLAIDVALDAASTTTDVLLRTIPASGDTRTYLTAPAPAWDGGVVRLAGVGDDLGQIQPELLDAAGYVLSYLDPSAITDADGTWTDADVRLPSPLPPGAAFLGLHQAKWGQPVRNVSVPLDVVPGVTVQRFWSPVFGNAHFYTADANEAARVRTDPNWVYEGPSFVGLEAGSDGSCQVGSPMYRFWSPVFSSHFYTMSAAEKAHIVAADRNWQYEGVVYCAYADQQPGTAPLYRFWSPNFGKHFFTADQGEADHIRAVDRNWQYEGIAAYVIPGA